MQEISQVTEPRTSWETYLGGITYSQGKNGAVVKTGARWVLSQSWKKPPPHERPLRDNERLGIQPLQYDRTRISLDGLPNIFRGDARHLAFTCLDDDVVFRTRSLESDFAFHVSLSA